MKLNENYVLRDIGNEKILIPCGKETRVLNGVMMPNEMAVFVWNNIESVSDIDELINLVLSEYDVDEDTAKRDIGNFVNNLIEVGMVIK